MERGVISTNDNQQAQRMCYGKYYIIYFRKLNQGNDKHSMFLVYFILKMPIWRSFEWKNEKKSPLR